ncbi:MAG: flagellar biosynthesis protein FlgA [Alicyclobacillus macrosporangiidus]|uniref:SAF domain-containing protein n=1 Tax=Alicyclobacillus macrosporangiidus TaxID=392015 RepID=UPI0026EACF23|nr:SAF domain-containing protein [Alicyclobacillus macrosporangiidus]MCL6601014.1 flagellar biosynthesis protein FlgA [Alicyclobacillus macrosporangiidus]
MKPWLKYATATTLFVIGVGGSIAYNQFLAPYLGSRWVYVAARQLEANTPIRDSDIKRVRLPKDEVSPDAVTDVTKLTGAYTAQAMSQNQQFTALNTQPNPFTITPGTEDVPIPSGWIAAMSPTLRQGDYVDIIPMAQPQQAGPGQTPLVAGGVDTTKPVLSHILVLSVHTSSNQEVTNQPPGGSQTVGARQNGSGTPSVLDLKMTNDQAGTLARLIQQKYQLLIVGVAPDVAQQTNP